MNRTSPSKGFTLMELVVVIVVLGLLAITALPKFINLSDSARTASFEGLTGALHAAADMAYLQQRTKGKQLNDDIVIDGTTITMINGYPSPRSMRGLVVASGGKWELEDPSNPSSWSGAENFAEYMWVKSDGTYNRKCRVYYYIDANMTEYVVQIDESGC
ncbi:prepilin-type N-terminal cleavage/methylation domain-containing protein [Shewanella sp. UCD-KL21]|uniref:prepilin-type N-terminal cleavage/methylation domain-containing protein n=1 Tax=Shewanella sp. UCD-KL21 TaxID=1917164 RepID=UPI000970FC01|nr:prepilin-type N-terminal cleavage/methylation domain-containing protein [Shewanella sp. UCD-KL21]